MSSDMSSEIRGFQILRVLGSGTSGTVFEVIRKADGRKLALKVLNNDIADPHIYSLLSRINHPHILTPEGIETSESGQSCLLFRLIRSTDPRQDMAQGGPPAALSLLVQALSAVSYLHSHGLVHADIKPNNLLCEPAISNDSSGLNLVLADFDFAVQSQGGGRSQGATGTLGYMAPEVLSSGASTFQTDVFALGAWFYWVVTGVEPFGADNLRDALARLEHYEELTPIGRIDHRYANAFWDELIERMTAKETSSRFAHGNEALRFLLENAASAVEENGMDIPRLLWNPSALLSDEARAVTTIQAELGRDRVKPPLVVLRDGRHSALREIARQLSRSVSYKDPTIICSGEFSYTDFDRVLADKPESLIIDNMGVDGCFTSNQIASFLRLIGLSRSKEARGVGIVIVLETSNQSYLQSKWDGLRSLFDIIEVKRIPPNHMTDDSVSAFFSGADVDRDLMDNLEGIGVSDVDAFVRAVDVGLRYGGLSISMGKVALHPRRGTQFLTSPVTAAQLADPDICANGVYEFLSKLPSGLSRDTVAFLKSVIVGFEVSLDEALHQNVIRWTSDEQFLVCAKGIRFDVFASEKVRREVRAICDAICGAKLNKTDGSEEELIAGAFGTHPQERMVRRTIAFCRALFKHGRVSEAFGIMKEVPTLGKDWLLAKARWHETRASIVNGLGEFDKSQLDYEEAARYYKECGRHVLAGRVLLDFSIEARGWSKAELADSLRYRAEELLSRASATSRERLVCVIRAEEVNNMISSGQFEEAKTQSEAMISGRASDSRARAICYRVLALNSLRAGDLEAARLHYARGILCGRNARDAKVLSRVLVSVAIFESTRGYYLRGERIMKRVLAYPPGAVRNSEKYSAWTGLGGMAFESGRMQQALEINVRALALCEHTRDSMRIGHAETNVALILGEMGRTGESLAVALTAAEHRKVLTGERAQAWNLTGRAYVEIGSFDLAEEFLMKCLDEEQGAKTPVTRATVYRDFAIMEKARGNVRSALSYLRQSKTLADEFKARDESLDAEFFLTILDPEVRLRANLSLILGDLLARARQIGNQRTQDQIRAAIAENDSSIPLDARIEEVDRLLSTALAGGYGSFVLTLLRIKAELLIEKKDFERAQDALRETLNRIRIVADSLPDPSLRKTYLSDPRRQRILELIRKARSS